MPIRLKEGQRPKYRMIHATNHEDGCVLMNDNICKRWEVLKNIQNEGQAKLFKETIENQVVDMKDIKGKVEHHINQYMSDTPLNIILADFFTEYGVLVPSRDICKILKSMEKSTYIIVSRIPPRTITGKPSTFFTQNSKQKVLLRRKP